MEDRKHYWEDICIPRNEFIKEHVHLLKLLKHGNRTQLLAEAKDQGAELQRETGGGGVPKHHRIKMNDDDWRKLSSNQQRAANEAALALMAAAARRKVLAIAAQRHVDLGEAAKRKPPTKGGSRAAGYIKKLIAMYKDGQEGFDIQKMKWASDNLKAFGISMEEDEGPVGADDYSEYSPKEASIRRKIDALAKKANKEGNTAENRAEYKRLRTLLKQLK
jgi:hypothetical protein